MKVDSKETGLRSVLNFRDAGGAPVNGGYRIRKGVIFRSANPDRISKGDILEIQKLGIRTVIDLRAGYEHKKNKKAIPGVETVSLPLDFEQKTREKLYPYFFQKNSEEKISQITHALYLEITDAAGPVLSRIVEILTARDSGPMLIHCQAGKDRTGIIIALIHLLLEADPGSIVSDYMKSNFYLLPFFRRMLLIRKIMYLGFFPAKRILNAIEVKQEHIEAAMERVTNHFGGILNYAFSSGIDPGKLKLLRERLLVKEQLSATDNKAGIS